LSALTSPKLGPRALKPGDEVLTVRGVSDYGESDLSESAVPVFCGCRGAGYEIDVTKLEAAYSPKMKAVMIAHTLGNVFNLDAISAFCKKYNLWLVEDWLATRWGRRTRAGGGDVRRYCDGEFLSAHHITMGEGGAVIDG